MEKEKGALMIQDCILVYQNAFVMSNSSKFKLWCQEKNEISYNLYNKEKIIVFIFYSL